VNTAPGETFRLLTIIFKRKGQIVRKSEGKLTEQKGMVKKEEKGRKEKEKQDRKKKKEIGRDKWIDRDVKDNPTQIVTIRNFKESLLRGRLSTVDVLIKITCWVKKKCIFFGIKIS
jgi:hypothetical protein